jgi:lysophospholipase L1-like esterase
MNWTGAIRVARTLVPGMALLAGVSCGGPNTPSPPVDPPSVACPASMSVSGVVGGSQAVSFALPTVSGGTQPVGITCTPGSGSTFSVGSTTVACTASDASSRTAQCTFTVTLSPALRLPVTKFMAFGDSVTEGQNGRLTSRGGRVVDVPNSYPTQLESMLNTEYAAEPVTVVNRGYGGSSVDDLRQKLPGDLKSFRPGAVLLLGGYNDLLASCRPKDAATPQCATATTDVASGIRKMIVSSKEAAIKYIFVSTLTPSGPYLGVGMDRRIADSAIVTTNNKLINVVRSEGVMLVDPYPVFLGHEAEYVDQDGLHLRPVGNQALAGTFFSSIKNTIPSTPALN